MQKRSKPIIDEILTAEQAAAYLKISPVSVRSHALAGKLPATKFGDDWRFMRGQLYDYLVDQAACEQRARQDKNKIVNIAKQDGAMPAKRSRGRPSDTSAAEIIAKYGGIYGVGSVEVK